MPGFGNLARMGLANRLRSKIGGASQAANAINATHQEPDGDEGASPARGALGGALGALGGALSGAAGRPAPPRGTGIADMVAGDGDGDEGIPMNSREASAMRNRGVGMRRFRGGGGDAGLGIPTSPEEAEAMRRMRPGTR